MKPSHRYPFGLWLILAGLAGAISFLALKTTAPSIDPAQKTRLSAQRLVRGFALASFVDGRLAPPSAQRWLDSLQKALPSDTQPTRAFLLSEKSGGLFAFLKQKSIVASLDPKAIGRSLKKTDPDDKALFDLSSEIESRSQTLPNALLLYDLPSLQRLQAVTAIRHQGKFLAAAVIEIPFPKTPNASASPAYPLLLSWGIACLFFAILLFFLRGPWAHLVGIFGLAAVAFYPYVLEVERQQDAWQDEIHHGHTLLSLMLRETPHATEAWLDSILGTPTQATLHTRDERPTPVYRMKRDPKGFQIEIMVLISPIASASWPRHLAVGVAALLFYTLLGFGFFHRLARTLRLYGYAYLYIFPAMLGMLVLVFLPFLVGLGLSFFRHLGGGNYEFVGFQNFLDILRSPLHPFPHPLNFYFTLLITLLWTALNVAFHVAIGLGLALLLKNPLLRLKTVYRVLLILPWAIPNYITALIWKGMFHQQFGAINALLTSVGLERVSWFSSTTTAFTANLITNTWLGFPFMMVVSLGALQSIPSDLYEAADVDGATSWQKFVYITLPLLKPALFPSIILGSIWTFNMFNIIYLVSGGEPGGATDILITEAYRWAFQRGERYGYAAAYSTIIFLLLLAYSLFTNRLTKATEGIYQGK